MLLNNEVAEGAVCGGALTRARADSVPLLAGRRWDMDDLEWAFLVGEPWGDSNTAVECVNDAGAVPLRTAPLADEAAMYLLAGRTIWSL